MLLKPKIQNESTEWAHFRIKEQSDACADTKPKQ